MIKKKHILLSIAIILNSMCSAQLFEEVGGGVSYQGSFACRVKAIDVFNNNLYISGCFDTAGNVFRVPGIAKWTGTRWDTVGLGMILWGEHAHAFCSTTGSLYAGGNFSGVLQSLPDTIVPHTENLAKWNGVTWEAVSQVSVGNTIYSIEEFNGDIYIGGIFTNVGGLSVSKIAGWNGSSWNGVAGGVSGSVTDVRCMAVYNGELYVSGEFTHAGNVNARCIARWNGVSWDSVGSGLNTIANDMIVDSVNNVLYVAGGFTEAGGIQALQVAKWDGNFWSALDTTNLDWAYAMEFYHGELYIGTSTHLFKWDGYSMQSGCTVNNTIMSLKSFNDSLYIGGYFDTLNGMPISRIARYYSPNTTIIKSQEGNQYFKIYPNPGKKEITVEFEANSKQQLSGVNIYNIQGKLEKEVDIKKLVAIKNKIIINIESLKGGNYILELRDSEGKKYGSEKFVVD